jgi:hypothetical protein
MNCKHSPQPLTPGQAVTGYAHLYECPWCKIESLTIERDALRGKLQKIRNETRLPRRWNEFIDAALATPPEKHKPAMSDEELEQWTPSS